MDDVHSGPPSFTRRQLFDIIQNQKGANVNEVISSHVISSLNIENCSAEISKKVLQVISRFTSEISKRWESSSRTLERFLHAWIRFYECLIHISYRLEIKKWQVRGAEDQQKVKQRKQEIVERFRSEMGLLVDQPKPGGSGTTNDGNSARRFFENAALSSTITGISRELIDRFGIILLTIASGFEINPEAYEKFATQTARLFIQLYPWYYMPASVHKILVHGSQVISSSILPIGQLSEEAQEARNKDMKKFREAHTRKCSREKTNEDLFNLLLISSDPVISSVRPLPTKRRSKIPPEVIALLAPPAINPKQLFPDEVGETIQDETKKDEADTNSDETDTDTYGHETGTDKEETNTDGTETDM